jgi:hypothetical protein
MNDKVIGHGEWLRTICDIDVNAGEIGEYGLWRLNMPEICCGMSGPKICVSDRLVSGKVI